MFMLYTVRHDCCRYLFFGSFLNWYCRESIQ